MSKRITLELAHAEHEAFYLIVKDTDERDATEASALNEVLNGVATICQSPCSNINCFPLFR
jgi:hypothetical protein